MKIIVKNSVELSEHDFEKLYNVFKDNMTDISDGVTDFSDKYKRKWIDNLLNNNKLVCLYYDGNDLLGYIFLHITDTENHVSEFQIVKKYQHLNNNFREMIKLAIPYLNQDLPCTFTIWKSNIKMMSIVRMMGANINNNGKFEISVSDVNKWLSGEN